MSHPNGCIYAKMILPGFMQQVDGHRRRLICMTNSFRGESPEL